VKYIFIPMKRGRIGVGVMERVLKLLRVYGEVSFAMFHGVKESVRHDLPLPLR
jgi:hypothetical protein